MTFREVFLGELGDDEDLDWGGDPFEGNIPIRLGPLFPPAPAIRHPYDLALEWIECKRLQGQRVDWGASAARICVADLLLFLSQCYGAYGIPAELVAFVSTLPASRRYALVASKV